MKKIISIFAAALCMVSCGDMLDIVPKGKTTLDKTTDLEMLLTQEWTINASYYDDLMMICNESLGGLTKSIAEMLAQPNTLEYAYLTYDENIDRAAITPSDTRYENMYKYINYMNVVISKIGDAEGNDERKPAIKAEARVMRAYLHWLLVNIYAKQYDEATASTEGGIPYVDDTDVSVQKTKLTVAEVYDRILADCSDEVIAALPEKNTSVERGDRAWGNAVRAMVLKQMKLYDRALPYAQEALRLNGAIEDRSSTAEVFDWVLPFDYEGNYLFFRGATRSTVLETLSRETAALFEDGDYVLTYVGEMGWSYMFGEMFAGISGVPMYFGFYVTGNSWGLTSDRMYYTAAECLIRTGQIRAGLEYVDRVRARRVEGYTPFTDLYDQAGSMTESEAMALLQPAKWIECTLVSYENFFDCKRWNTEPDYRRTITRDLDEYGQYSIGPDSPLWVLPFPANAVRYNSSLTQNY